MKHIIEEIEGRMTLGKERYGHGVKVDSDTTTWGTSTDSWIDMANEEFLDAIIYLTADYIRTNRDPQLGKMGQMELRYMTHRPGFTEADDPEQWMKDNPLMDDNELIKYIIRNRCDIEPCRYKTLLCTLMNILDLDQFPSTAFPSGLVPDDDNSSLDSDMSLSSFGEFQTPF